MLKKSLIFGSVALLLTALIALTGCPTESSTTERIQKENYLYGSQDAETVQRAADDAKAGGRPLVLTDGLTITGGDNSDVDLTGVDVRVEGSVNIGDSTSGPRVNAAHVASLTFNGGSIYISNGTFIYNRSDDYIYSTGTNGKKALLVTDPLYAPGTATHVAVDEYTIGTGFDDIAKHVTSLYVLKKLTVNRDSVKVATPLTNLVALGEVVITDDNPVAFADAQFTFASTATLTTTKVGGVSITLPATDARLGGVKAESGSDITVLLATGGTALTVGTVAGPGNLYLPSATTITIGGVAETGNVVIGTASPVVVTLGTNAGKVIFSASKTTFANANGLKAPENNGSIVFSGTVEFTGALGDAAASANKVAGAGTITFTDTVSFGAATLIGSKVEFEGDVTASAAATTFGGDVVLGYGKKITLDAFALTISAGKKIYVAETAVLEASSALPVELTPAANTTLTAGKVYDEEAATPDPYDQSKTLLVGGGALTIAKGSLKVLAGTVLYINGKTVTVDGTNTDNPAALVLEGDATLGFNYDSSASGTLAIGQVAISDAGTSSGFLTASGTVTFKPGEISGIGATLAYGALVEDGPGAIITVGNTTTAGDLTLKGVTLDLSDEAGSALTIAKDVSAAASRVILAAGAKSGKIIFIPEAGSPVTWAYVKAGITGLTPAGGSAGTAAVSGTGAATGEDEAGATLGSIEAGATTNVILTGESTNNTVLGNGVTTKS